MTIFQLSTIFTSKYINKRLKASTARGYTVNINNHILPVLSGCDVSELTVDHLDKLTEVLQKKGLSNKSVVYVHATLRKMYSFAVKRGIVKYTPYSAYDLPRVQKYRHTVLNIDDMQRLLKVSYGTDMYIPIMLALKYGLRRGEILGLKKRDIDISGNTLHVQRNKGIEHGKTIVDTVKTSTSDRRILLSPVDLQELSSASGRDYIVQISPNMIDKKFKKLLRDHSFPDVRFHDLRHSYATYMLSQGVK